MKSSKIWYVVLPAIVVAIILIAGRIQLPKYASRLTFLAILAIIDILYWFSVRKIISTRFKTLWKVVYWLPMALLLMFFIAGIISPYPYWPAFPRIYFAGILLITLIGKGIFLILILLSDILLIPFYIIKLIKKQPANNSGRRLRPKFFLFFSAGIASVVMLAYISGMFFWVSDFKLNTIEIPVKDLPKEFDGYKIIQLSDIHLGSFLSVKPMEKVLDIVNAQHPDLILFTGDMVNFVTDEAITFESVMKRFSAKDGVYSILGNHDYGEYSKWNSPKDKKLNDNALFTFYKKINWHLLKNENVIISRDSATIAVIGVENWSVTKRFGKKGDLRKALIGSEQANFKILMSHDPTHWDGEVNKLFPQVGLTLSGHTHAFQFAIENGSVKWSPASMLFKEWGGLYEKAHDNGTKQFLYVNRGIGTLGYPGRIVTRPEITLIILRKVN